MPVATLIPAPASERTRRTLAERVLGRPASDHRRATDATHDVLGAAASSRSLDAWASDLELDGDVVDHLLLNRAGAFAVTSTWHDQVLTAVAMGHGTAAAASAAERVRDVVRTHGVTVRVHTVLAVWGAGADDVPAGGVEVGEVLIIRGDELAAFVHWSASFGSAWTRTEATDCLLDLHDVTASERVLVAS